MRRLPLLLCLALAIGGCQTRRQAKLLTASSAIMAVVGGYLESRARIDGEWAVGFPVTVAVSGTTAVISGIGVAVLDARPRLVTDPFDRPWEPEPRRGATELLAALQHDGCFGYRAAIYRDGIVEYESSHGRDRATGRISLELLHELEQRIVQAGYLALGDVGDGDASFHSKLVVTWYRPRAGSTKRVVHGGHGPDALLFVEGSIDAAVRATRWIAGAPEPGCFDQKKI